MSSPFLVFSESSIKQRKTISAQEISDNERRYGRLSVGKSLLDDVRYGDVIEIIVRKSETHMGRKA